MSGLQIASDLEAVERDTGHELGLGSKKSASRKLSEYAQFEQDLRREAALMSEFYEIFYCLENSIRRLVSDVLTDAEGADWWTSSRVDNAKIREPAERAKKKEVDHYISPRSENWIDYTSFQQLSQLITDNWDLFDAIFTSKTAVSNLTNQLSVLRGPIAHCTLTDEIEQKRLSLMVESWFKIMS
ncbi:Swt1 family HEPN domain-containing protein [Pseudooceanicola nitratireducens]|jgi:hypothetical protein|uniref:Swt1 family HEPN domain-containing protein n=1 Tax=Pseudooceanicola nitratireducens TaxID=517719 RepID=UPI003516CD31